MSVRAKKRLKANKNIKGKAKDYARANNGTFEFKKLLEIQDL